jgi:hypothetical protein
MHRGDRHKLVYGRYQVTKIGNRCHLLRRLHVYIN